MEKIRLSKSSISKLEYEGVAKVLENEYLGMGNDVRLFEEEIKAFLKTPLEVVCVNTGTSALHLSLLCLDIGPGDEVLVPSLTYVATFQAISGTGATPVPCEVSEDSLFLDLNDAKNRLTAKTRAIVPVHYASNSAQMPEVHEFARANSLRVIEDAAHSFGCTRDGKPVGYEGDVLCFSFDGIKNITSGEGGAILSGDEEFLQRAKDARLLSVEKDTDKRYSGQRSWDFDVKFQGFRYHMSNIMAAIGRAQLSRFADFKTVRQRVVRYYLENLNINEIELLDFDFDNIVSHIFVVKAKDRDKLREYLLENGVECGIHYKPNHLLSKYKTSYGMPVTERVYNRILTLPCHADITIEQQERVVKVIRAFYGS